MIKCLEITDVVSQWLKLWHLKPWFSSIWHSMVWASEFPESLCCGKGAPKTGGRGRLNNFLANPRVELKTPAWIPAEPDTWRKWRLPSFPQWQCSCSQPSIANVEADLVGLFKLFIYKMEIVIHRMPKDCKHLETEVPFKYLHPMCFLLQINPLNGTSLVWFLQLRTLILHTTKQEVSFSNKEDFALDVRGFPF